MNFTESGDVGRIPGERLFPSSPRVASPTPPCGEGVEATGAAYRLSDRAPGHALITRLQRMGATAPLTAETRPWFLGAAGEVAVGTELLRLGPEWLILHSVPVGAGDADIDHVVVGPPGVFTINTKHHRGKDVWVGDQVLTVAGQRTSYLRKARFEGQWTAARLSSVVGTAVPVYPLIALVGVRGLTMAAPPRDVRVLRAQQVARWLNTRPPRLSPETLSRLQAAADVPGTWQDRPAPVGDGTAVLAWYRTLETASGYRRRPSGAARSRSARPGSVTRARQRAGGGARARQRRGCLIAVAAMAVGGPVVLGALSTALGAVGSVLAP